MEPRDQNFLGQTSASRVTVLPQLYLVQIKSFGKDNNLEIKKHELS